MSNERRHPCVINVSEAASRTQEHGQRFALTAKALAVPTGAKAVGCNWFEVPPGRSAFPRHFHCAIEEALFILEGHGKLRIGDDEVTVESGDWVTLPPGPDHAHILSNDGTGPLRYLAISNKAVADVVGYPDSNKIAAAASPSANFFDPPWVRAIFKADTTVDYYDGED